MSAKAYKLRPTRTHMVIYTHTLICMHIYARIEYHCVEHKSVIELYFHD